MFLLEIERVEKGDTEKDAESYLDLFTQKNIKLKERVLIPVKQYPKVSVTVVFRYTCCAGLLDYVCAASHLVLNECGTPQWRQRSPKDS